MLPLGYVAHTGKRLTDQDVHEYNDIQRKINAWIEANRAVPEELLDWSHRKFREISERSQP